MKLEPADIQRIGRRCEKTNLLCVSKLHSRQLAMNKLWDTHTPRNVFLNYDTEIP